MSDLMFPVYEFRPIPGGPNWLRWNDGNPIPDDGKWDLAFISLEDQTVQEVFLGYQKNIVWAWCTGHWSACEPRHPRGNAWHYALRNGEHEWGGDWGSSRHPNRTAADAAMSWLSSRKGCANGTGPDSQHPNQWTKQGLLRIRETGEIVRPPTDAKCMYCGLLYTEEGEHEKS